MLLWGDTQIIVEGVLPDLLHVVPVGHDSALDGVLRGENIPLGPGLISDLGVLLSHANLTHNGWEDGPVDGKYHQK